MDSVRLLTKNATIAYRTKGEEKLDDLANLFKVFADTTRLRILYCLFAKEQCVKEIAQTLRMAHSAISHQLRFLKQSKLVKTRRNGQTIVYSLADKHVQTIFNQGLRHISEGK